ncbi:MAG: non-ribosomal peptide synthetase [Prochlorococcaceae cyanobacterium]
MSTSSSPGTAPRTLLELVQAGERVNTGDPVLLDPAGATLDWAGLNAAVAAVWSTLEENGIGREDRVALVTAPGPQSAAALLATMTHAVAAPLNPRAPESAHRDDLQRLGVSLVLTDPQPPPALLAAAAGLGLRVHRLAPLPASGEATSLPQRFLSAPQPSDLALLLQTSGTTSRPKVVPLGHANLLASAGHVAEVLELKPVDRSLAVMPLFHIHGIVAGLLAPLLSGGSVICSEPLPGADLLDLIHSSRATWLSAVPTLLQGLVSACGPEGTAGAGHALRLIRSSSAPLAPALAQRLEMMFGVPVIEAYGMTEAAHQICSNHLPPGRRLAGSVGLAAGPEVAVVGADHQPLPAGQVGEVAIRGTNVTVGYLEVAGGGWVTSPDGSSWFLTGDEGSLDPDGVLRLTGRLKEMINRGGEKVIPRQVDEALMEHPAVEQAICFSVPHPTLGEDVAAAVVLRPGALASEDDLRAHCFARLAPHEVPSRIVTVDEVPKGPTGKLQRIGLAAKLDNLLSPMEEPPEGEVEELVGQIFADVLGIPLPSRDSNFFALGGDSLTGQQVISRLNSEIPLDLPATLLFRYPTLRMLAAELGERIDHALAALEEGQHGP